MKLYFYYLTQWHLANILSSCIFSSLMFHAYNRAAFPSARFSSRNAFSAIETFNIYAVNRSQVSIERFSIASHGRSYLKKDFKVISIREGYVR